MSEEYPVADFYESVQYGWSEVEYEVDKAIRQWFEETLPPIFVYTPSEAVSYDGYVGDSLWNTETCQRE